MGIPKDGFGFWSLVFGLWSLDLKCHDIVYTEKCHDIVLQQYEIEFRCGTRWQIAHSTSEPRSGSDRVNLWWHPWIVFTKTYAQGESLPSEMTPELERSPDHRMLGFFQD